MIIESPVSRQELISYLQKHVDWNLNKNQRYGINLWVLISSMGFILFQLLTRYSSLEIINNDSITFLAVTINFLLLFWTFIMDIQKVPDYSILISGNSACRKEVLLFAIQEIVLIVIALINNASLNVCYEKLKIINLHNYDFGQLIYDTGTGYYYLSPDLMTFSGMVIFSVFLLWNMLVIFIPIFYIYDMVKKNHLYLYSNIDESSFLMRKPPSFFVSSIKNLLVKQVLFVTAIIAIFDFIFRCVLIKSDLIIFCVLLIGLVILIIMFLGQFIDKINEETLLRESGQVVFSYEEDHEIRYRIKQVLQIVTIVDWIGYIFKILDHKKFLLQKEHCNEILYSKAYLTLNKLDKKSGLLDECVSLKKKYMATCIWLKWNASDKEKDILKLAEIFIDEFGKILEKEKLG